jgi:hypothetical protein
MITTARLLTPADLGRAPDLDASRPNCRCGAVARPGCVGLHGDGLTRRVVPWPVFDPGGSWSVVWVTAVGRRYWCPACRATVRVAHPGLRRGARFGAALIAALLRVIAARPFGEGSDDADAHQRVHGRPLPLSERVRGGRPRWAALRRWARAPERIWTHLALPAGDTTARLHALLAAFGLGGSLPEVLDAAVRAHAPGGRAM